MKDSNIFLPALLATLIGVSAQAWLSRLPDVKPESAPATEFSGAGAMKLLGHLLQENEAHPVGSEANHRVRSRITAWLDQAGIAYEIQADWGCASRHNTCGWVENIIATIPGTHPGAPYVAMMAHYDSVPAAPGAGDDAAGVVAILETARAMLAHGPQPNPLMLVLTDGEEAGLLGAEAFFKFHPLARQIGVILNVEGSGTTGPSIVIRTSFANSGLMRRYGEGAQYPYGLSLANEVFKRMPNDTDFSVSLRAGIPGIDFAFSAERNHYHTPNDSVVNLNPRTVQHHGEQLLPTALHLAGTDLTSADQGHSVFTEYYGQWAQWPAGYSAWMTAAIALFLFLAAARQPGNRKQFVFSIIVVPLTLLLGCSLATFLAFKALNMIHGTTVSWPAHQWAFRMVLFASMLTTGLIVARLLSRKIPMFTVLLGCWVFWWLLALLLVIGVPDAANVLLIPLLPASLVLLIAARAPLDEKQRHRLCVLTLLCVAPFLPLSLLLEQSQGYRLIFSTFIFISLYSVALGAFIRGAGVSMACWAGVMIFVAGMLGASLLPLYSAWRPQHVNLHYIQNADEQSAWWRLRSQGPPPDTITAVEDFSHPEMALFPWSKEKSAQLAVAPIAFLPAPGLEVISIEKTHQGRTVQLHLQSNRQAGYLQLTLPGDVLPLSYQVGNNEVQPLPSDNALDQGTFRFGFQGVQAGGVDVLINFDGHEPVTAYLLDSDAQLPKSSARILKARAPLASPARVGDQAIVFRRYQF